MVDIPPKLHGIEKKNANSLFKKQIKRYFNFTI
jgi:hypothetical protein